MPYGCSFVLTCATYLHSRGWAPGLDKVDATLFADGFGSEGAVGGLISSGYGVGLTDGGFLSFVSCRKFSICWLYFWRALVRPWG